MFPVLKIDVYTCHHEPWNRYKYIFAKFDIFISLSSIYFYYIVQNCKMTKAIT